MAGIHRELHLGLVNITSEKTFISHQETFQRQELRVTTQKAKRVKKLLGKRDVERGLTCLDDVPQQHSWESPGQGTRGLL